jgi:hypothetical protein
MTATRYKAPKGFLAGSRYGLNLFDLFKEDSEGEGYSLSGFEGMAPQFRTQNLEKGRGGVLGYKTSPAAPKYSRVSEFSLIPEQGAGQAPSVTVNVTGGQQPGPEKEPEQKIDLGPLAQKYGASGLFGHMDYIKAKEEGYTDEQIGDWMRQNPTMVSEGNRPGAAGGLYEEISRGQVDTSKAQTRQWADAMRTFQAPGGELGPTQAFREATAYSGAPQISAQFGQDPTYFGAEDLKAARMSGYNDQAIKDFLEKNISLLRGVNVPGGESELGQLTAAFKQPETQASSGGGGSAPLIDTKAGASAEFFGHEDVNVAKARGASNEQIAGFIKQNQNLLRGTNVAGGGGLYDEYAQYMK